MRNDDLVIKKFLTSLLQMIQARGGCTHVGCSNKVCEECDINGADLVQECCSILIDLHEVQK